MNLKNFFKLLKTNRRQMLSAIILSLSLSGGLQQAFAQGGYRPITDDSYDDFRSAPVGRDDFNFNSAPGYRYRDAAPNGDFRPLNSGHSYRNNGNGRPRYPQDQSQDYRPSYRNSDDGSLSNQIPVYRPTDESSLGGGSQDLPFGRGRYESRYRDDSQFNGSGNQDFPFRNQDSRDSRYGNPQDQSRTFPWNGRDRVDPSHLPGVEQEKHVDPIEDVHARIGRRYQNASFRTLLNMPVQESLQLYTEVLNLIDTRHIEPTSMQARLDRGILNLTEALRDPVFVQTHRLNLQQGQAEQYGQWLRNWAAQGQLQSSSQLVGFVGQVAQASQQHIGLNQTACVMEFVYGACESLDKYSTFVPPEATPGASLQMQQQIVGIGVQIEMGDDGAEVKKVLSGSPAQEAGLKKGDIILAVERQQVTGKNLDQTVELITGPEGTNVQLTIDRTAQGPFQVSIPRRSIELHSINEVQMLGNSGVGYLKLDKFTATTNGELDNALWMLHQQGMQSLVMDLRGDPGGLLTTAIEVSDKFLPDGVIVSTKGRTEADNTQEVAKHQNTWKVPLVVLIDKDSASASEIFAAAIQENGRGVIVGRTSYGKGTVQTQFPLQTAGASLRITTAKFYSPKGRAMAGAGVVPDVWVDEMKSSSNIQEPFDHDVQEALRVAQQQAGNVGQNLSRSNVIQPTNGYYGR